ncbi:thrombospondin type 3 repeat-containing protein [Engelhardtia mirabilis]|uniref:Uncharacterized protein n=1 Tax=Engelhardtia mirabilis TaxID=2528011 RepID=A0A518BDF5_9BACT|nr:hypothetical protein Pla133_00590 [Planctomycetes bacterium Pla133]QDU99322.1 hypothetical protein Pla86_00590 [Planctomycetes bacterium Pla86]
MRILSSSTPTPDGPGRRSSDGGPSGGNVAAGAPPTGGGGALPTGGIVACGLILSAVTAILGLELGANGRGLAAAPSPGTAGDSDMDGVGNLAELVLGTDPLDPDTDKDGYTDLEEIALGTDPLLPDASVNTSKPSVGIASAAKNGFLVSRIAVYLPGGNLGTLDLSIGVVVKVFNGVGDSYVSLTIPSDFYISNGTLTVVDAPSTPGDRIVVVDVPIPQTFVAALGWMPVYAVATVLGVPSAAAAADTVMISGGIPYVIEEPAESMGQISIGGGSGVIYRPLLPPDDMPPTSSMGEICYQDVDPVGVVGGVVQYQVQTSECLPADSFCSSECNGMSGGSIDVYDPLLLIGG